MIERPEEDIGLQALNLTGVEVCARLDESSVELGVSSRKVEGIVCVFVCANNVRQKERQIQYISDSWSTTLIWAHHAPYCSQ